MNPSRISHLNRNRRTALLLASTIAALAVALNVISKPTGSDTGPGFLCRADFVDADVSLSTAAFRVVSDGPRSSCTPVPNDHPIGGSWDYWASSASGGGDPVCSGIGGGQNDVQSNGGRWIFSTGFVDRWIRVNWKGALDMAGKPDSRVPNPAAPNLDAVIYSAGKGPAVKNVADATVDHLHVRIAADNLFTPGVTRHTLTIEIFEILDSGTERNWSIVYKSPLYVDQDDPANPKVVTLSTVSPTEIPADDVPLAELRHYTNPARFITIGTYRLPLTILVRKTDIRAS